MSIAFALGGGTLFLWLLLALAMWSYRPPRPLWPTSFWFALSGLAWSLGELGTSFLAGSDAAHWRWLLVLYAGVLGSSPLWWALVLHVCAQHGARPRWASPLVERAPLVLAGGFFLALASNPWHGKFLEPVWLGRNHYGPIWYVSAVHGYLLMMASLALIVRAFLRQKRGTRAQKKVGMLFVAALAPLAANFVYITRLVETGYDPTVAAFGFGLIVGFIGIAREGLFGMSGLSVDLWIDHESDGVAIIDREGRLVRANPATAALFSGQEMVADLDFLSFLAGALELEDDGSLGGPSVRSSLLRAFTAESQPLGGHLFRLKSGARRWIRVTATPIPPRWPSAGGLGLRLRDETPLKETSERAVRQAASIEAILGSMRDGLFVADQTGRLLYANDRFWNMWRLPPVVPPTMDETSLVAELSARSESPSALTAAAVSEIGRDVREASEGSFEVALKSGQIFSAAVTPLRRGEQRIGRVWTFRDVTERRRAEQERARMEERIRESQKLESLGVLAGGIAHDFNNILVGILGNVDLATGTVDRSAPAYRHLIGIKNASDRAAELIQQVLAYAGRGQRSNRVLDLSVLVAETQDLVLTAISKKARLRPELAQEVFVEGDPVQLRQIVMNLLTNASDALLDEEGVITIRTGARSLDAEALDDALPPSRGEGGEYAFVEIKDTGCGMDARAIDRIFEPFYSTKLTGRGLGLSAALGIVRTHGGFFKVRSTPGKGSSFLLFLPRVEAPVDDRRDVEAPAEPPLSVAFPGTVLVVDDEEVVRDVARAALELAGYRVLTARDGQEGVELFREHRTRIESIVLDMTMPRMDGAEALFAIRQIARDVPVVLSSGYSEQDTMARCSGLSGVGFIQKPYTPERLIAKVSEAPRLVAARMEATPLATGRDRR